MKSSIFELDHPKEEAASRFVADVGRLLQTALVDRKTISKLTQQEIAERLGVDRSSVNRNFSGYRNLTLASLAELCWAMDVEPRIALEQLLAGSANHKTVGSRHLGISPNTGTSVPSKEVAASTDRAVITRSKMPNRLEYTYAR